MKKTDYNGHKNVISSALKNLRTSRGMSQGQLAAKLQTYGISIDQQMVSKIEHNARMVTDYELVYLSAALGVTPAELLPALDAL